MALTPVQSLYLITDKRLIILDLPEITINRVGHKAFGLSTIPPAWSPPFCLINHDTALKIVAEKLPLDTLGIEQIPWLAKLPENQEFILRSSATNETMDERGNLVSKNTRLSELSVVLEACLNETQDNFHPIHWILQPALKTELRGHLSNERRITQFKRDWMVEFDILDDPKTATPPPIRFGIRQWRNGTSVDATHLECTSRTGIDGALRQPAQWATEQKMILHFEWVWDGKTVWIVQADTCTANIGIDPNSLLPKSVKPVKSTSLQHFREVTETDIAKYRKLGNTKLYSELGYHPPAFYIIEDISIIEELIRGNPRSSIVDDLAKLTANEPLVVRSDGIDMQMLPRSDGLYTPADVIDWFSGTLPKKLHNITNWKESIVFICHNFIPALASAWSMVEPGKRVVRVEALWGIPEGMYWYSHDAYEIDTGEVNLQDAIKNKKKFRYTKRARYKDLFVAPDKQGKWCTHRTAIPYDWKHTISDDAHLQEIAITTRKIAEKLNFPVNVMWFIGVHKHASSHSILPWYHELSKLDKTALRVAPRFKQADSRTIELQTLNDWEKLQSRPSTEHQLIKRISVSPRESSLIRDRDFLELLAKFANQHNAVIELQGGVLSHAFYILQKAGCAVEIVDLFGATEENLVFKKVVRDKIPDTIIQKGESVSLLQIKGDQLVCALKSKLIEEALEVLDAKSTSDTVEELADVLEVIHAISHHLKVSMKSIEDARKVKFEERGGFKDGKVLVKTSAPSSLSELSQTPVSGALFPEENIIIAGPVSLEPEISLHQDEREVNGIKQRILEIELPTVIDGPITRNSDFELTINNPFNSVTTSFTGEWSLVRKKSDLKIRFTLSPFPEQKKLL